MSPYPQAALSTLEALYQLGKDICQEVEEQRPDIVIGLAHSGWTPVVVAQTLWTATHDRSFPPSMRTNIGQEKSAIYHARFGTDFPAFCFGECSDNPGRKGHYLAWVAEQSAWLKTLQKQIKAISPKTPDRILVVDDIFGGYRSGYATLALLEELYPEAKISMCAGQNDLTNNLVTGWLEEHAPALAQEIRKIKSTITYNQRYKNPWQETLKPLITGTEDITADSLNWKFITYESPAVKAIADYVTAEVALSAPAWVQDIACTYAMQRLKDEIKKDEVIEPEGDQDHLFPRWRLLIYPEERLAAKAWRQGGITNADVIQVYGSELSQIKKGLRTIRHKHEWMRHGEKAAAIYLPVDAGDVWVNIYPPTETAPVPKIPVSGFAELLAGELWAGVYPSIYNNLESVFLKDLMQLGIDSFLDLTNSKDFYRKCPYDKTLVQISREMGKKVEIKKLSMPFRQSPTKSQVEQVLKHIQHELKARRRIFIHAGYNLDARTPLILACLLIERGHPPKKALTEVNTFWMKTLHYLIVPPLNAEQEQFILNWKVK